MTSFASQFSQHLIIVPQADILKVNGFPRKDTTRAVLSEGQQIIIAHGFAKMREKAMSTTYRWLNMLPLPNCTSNPTGICSGAGVQITFELVFEVTYDNRRPSWSDQWDTDWDKDLCKSCAEQARVIHWAGRQKVWEKLPKYFGLESWEVLNEVSKS